MKNISKVIAIIIVTIFVLSAFAGLFGTLLTSNHLTVMTMLTIYL